MNSSILALSQKRIVNDCGRLLMALCLAATAVAQTRDANAAQGSKTDAKPPRHFKANANANVAMEKWANRFDSPMRIKSAGEYKAAGSDVPMYFESFSPLCLEPSATATFEILGGDSKYKTLSTEGSSNYVHFFDTEPAVRQNPSPPPFYTRAEGTISAFAWVPGKFEDVRVTGEVNVNGELTGKAATSRQGLLGRWDNGNNHYWFYVNFSTGKYGIVRSRFFGVLMHDLAGSSGPIKDFSNTRSYYLEFEIIGDTAQGRVYDRDRATGEKRLVGDTGKVVDPDPFPAGVSGVLVEKWIDSPFDPLDGSFANLTSTRVSKTARR